MSHIAKLFKNGRSQAVRLPAEYRFDSPEVYIRRDPQTGDVILSRKPATWEGFFAALKEAKVPADFLAAEARRQDAQDRDPFDGWKE
jgi:antitoxin VapB